MFSKLFSLDLKMNLVFCRVSAFFKFVCISVIITAFCPGLSNAQAPVDTAHKKLPTIVIIPVEGTVDAGMAAFISRSIRDSRKHGDSVIILEMDTFGGQVDAAFQIVDTILNIQNARITIAYVKTKAISAGALIALSANKLAMRPGTTIGDVAPLMMSQEGPKMLGEKFQSPLRAKFRTLARRNGYPEALAESMVTAELAVHEVKLKDTTMYLDSTGLAELSSELRRVAISIKTVVRSGELLTMDNTEALGFGFSSMTVESLDELLEKLGYGKAEVIRMEVSWSEALVRLIGSVAPILLMIGFAALYIELRTPGFGVPGLIGILCLGTVFLSQYMVGLADHTELLLIGLGLLLLAVEIFVTPGFGVIGFAGLAVIMAGAVLSFQGFVIPKPEFPWQQEQLIHNLLQVAGSLVGALALVFVFFRFALPRLGHLVKGPYLEESLFGVHIDSGLVSTVHAGAKGIASTALRPSGKAEFDGEVYDVVTEGDFVDRGDRVVVVRISGNRIVVIREQEQTS